MVVPIFAANDVTYRYPDGRLGLSEITLQVAPGESLAILGANASGKSTLLHVLAGLAFPESGTVLAFGDPLTQSALEEPRLAQVFRQRVGLLFQDADAMLFSPTVYDELAFGPLQCDLPAEQVRRRVEDLLDLLDLQPIAQQPPHALSGGEKRKVALAALLAVSPDVLLLDEPTASLDPRLQRWFVEFALTLRSLGKTLVTATHDLHVVAEIADRVIVLSEDHRIAAGGAPADILADLDLLYAVNLIHAHAHPHAGQQHAHPHLHVHDHRHQ